MYEWQTQKANEQSVVCFIRSSACMLGFCLNVIWEALGNHVVPRAFSTYSEEYMRRLIREIWKHKFLYHVVRFPAVTDNQYNSMVKDLEKMEKENPACKKYFSPSGVHHFDEVSAENAFGGREDWLEVKRTLMFITLSSSS